MPEVGLRCGSVKFADRPRSPLLAVEAQLARI